MLKRIFYHQKRVVDKVLDVWHSRYPKPESTEAKANDRLTIGEKLAMYLIEFVDFFSFSQTLKWAMFPKPPSGGAIDNRRRRRNFVDLYTLTWTGALAVFLYLWNDLGRFEGAVKWIGIYIIVEMFVATLKIQIVHFYDKDNQPKSPNRTIILLLLGYLQIAIVFAMCYLSYHCISMGKTPISDPGQAFYFSSITIMTVGYGDITPDDATGRGLAVAEAYSGLILLAFFLARFVSIPSERLQQSAPAEPEAVVSNPRL